MVSQYPTNLLSNRNENKRIYIGFTQGGIYNKCYRRGTYKYYSLRLFIRAYLYSYTLNVHCVTFIQDSGVDWCLELLWYFNSLPDSLSVTLLWAGHRTLLLSTFSNIHARYWQEIAEHWAKLGFPPPSILGFA